jgi:CRP-like cAMP-binding protein
MVTMRDLLSSHPFLAGLPERWLERLSYQASRSIHHAGSRFFHEGLRAEHFWLIREGRVAVEYEVPGRGTVVIDRLGPGAVLGWSWMFPPVGWHFGAVAEEQTLSIVFDGRGVRRLCDEDPALGYELTRRFAAVLVDRLRATRRRLAEQELGPAAPGDPTPVLATGSEPRRT